MKIVPLFFQYSGGAFVEFYQEKDENRLHSVVNWIVDIAVVIAFACYLVYGFGGRIEVNGGSMKPALDSGDVVLVNRLAYALGSPRRFDIAVFSQGDQAFNMKRIIGLPGETVQIRKTGSISMESLWKQRGRWTRPPSPGWQNIPWSFPRMNIFSWEITGSPVRTAVFPASGM